MTAYRVAPVLLHAIIPAIVACGGEISLGTNRPTGSPATGGASGSVVVDAGDSRPDAVPLDARREVGPTIDAGARLYPTCDSWPDNLPPVSDKNGPECAGLEALVLSAFTVKNAMGGDRLSPGDQATVRVSYTLTGSANYTSYPCVGVMADNPGVSFGRPQNWPHHEVHYAIFAGQEMTIERQVVLDAGIAPGTEIRFIAWATSLTSACIYGVAELPVTVS